MLPTEKRSHYALIPLLVVLGINAISATAIGVLYGILIAHSPHVIFNLVLVACVGLAVGWVYAKSAVAWVLPSRAFLVIASLAAAFVALYVSWGITAATRVPNLGMEALDPRFLATYMKFMYDNGALTVEGANHIDTYRGPSLAAVWILEAILIAAGSAVASMKFFNARRPPVCEQCHTWKSTVQGVIRCGVPGDIQTFVDRLSTGAADGFDELPDASVDDDYHLRVDMSWCPTCRSGCVVSVSIIDYASEPTEQCISSCAVLGGDSVTTILARGTRQRENDPDAAHSLVPVIAPEVRPSH